MKECGADEWGKVIKRLVLSLFLWTLWSGSAAAQCGGMERWPVKVGSDAGASQVDLANPVRTLLHDLVSILRPQLPSDDDTRLPDERTVRMVDGRLIKFKLESGRDGDQDYHLVISDDTLQYSQGGSSTQPSPHSFVAEIVNANCVPGRHGDPSTQSHFQSQLAAVRAKFDQQFPNISGGWNDAGGTPVRLTGVGFFDRPHGQVGRALNGIEIHPVLDIVFNSASAPVAPAASPLLQNPGFESGSQGWTASADVVTDDPSEPARSGSWKAWLGGYGTSHTDTLWQQVTLPATAQAVTLTFYLHVSTEEQQLNAYDKLRVRVRDGSGKLLKALRTFSNLQAAPGFSLQTFSLTAYRGQTIRIELAAQEDSGSMTSFVVDDFAIVVQ